MYLKSVLIVFVFLNFEVSYQNRMNVDSSCCGGSMPWQYISYYPNIQVSLAYWPYVHFPIHHYYFRPPLSYHYYNPCLINEPYCYELSKIYKCCVDYCGRTKCEQIYDCEIETIASGDGPESDEEDTKCMDSGTLFFENLHDNRIDIVDEDTYYSDFVFDNN